MEFYFTLEEKEEKEEEEEEKEGRFTFYSKSTRKISSAALGEVTSPENTDLSAPTSKKNPSHGHKKGSPMQPG